MKHTLTKKIALIAMMAFMLFLSIGAKADDSEVTTYAAPETSIDTGTTTYAAPDSFSTPLTTSGGLSADAGTGSIGTSAQSVQDDLISAVIWCFYAGVMLVGAATLLMGFYELRLIAEQNNRSKGRAIALIFVGFLMFSGSSTVNTMMHTIRGDGTGMCFVSDSQLISKLSSSSGCWDTATSEINGVLKDRILAQDSDAKTKFLENLKTIVFLFQCLGVIYFFLGLNGLKKIADGSKGDSHWKHLWTIVFSVLIIDLPHTATVFIDTLQKLGVKW
ncbi:hypothetical protein [Pseudomonas savastanoi]|uniref:hypothetical protein n=1 Tax=Pseudomonas savastanoi TaxID=29438 RepID=UPI00070B5372|nr:hypothetical protein [Pseudomonas savastanoi]KWT09188.1 hypothetical protein AL047_17410 [Pseudomonas syringae pv. broussonetiae]